MKQIVEQGSTEIVSQKPAPQKIPSELASPGKLHPRKIAPRIIAPPRNFQLDPLPLYITQRKIYHTEYSTHGRLAFR